MSETENLSGRLNTVAAKLSGIAPLLRMITDRGDTPAEVGNSLESVGALSEYLNSEICNIASDIEAMSQATA